MVLGVGWVSDSPTFAFLSPFTASPTLTGSVPESKAPGAAGPAQAGLGPGNTSSPIEGLRNNRCLFSCPLHSSEVGGGVPPPGSGGRALASLKVPARPGRGPRGVRAFKSLSGRLFSCWFTTCLPPDTSATMWFLVLCLALSLAGTGAAPTAPAIQSRIVGGWECKKGSQPWQAALFHYHQLYCGAVLIHPQWALTAAHCIGKNYQLWLGVHSLYNIEEEGQYAQVSQSFPHPQFNLSLLKNHTTYPEEDYSYDIMLLRLQQPAQMTDTVGILDLPTQEPQLGSTCYASGWGSYQPYPYKSPENLQCVDLELLPNEDCVRAHPEKVTDVMLCAGHMTGGKDTCVGDSGGPLICNGVLQGITSWGHTPCARPKKPSVFTKLVSILDWIKETMAANP